MSSEIYAKLKMIMEIITTMISIMFMWISIAATKVVLPNGLFTAMENVINKIIQPLNRRL